MSWIIKIRTLVFLVLLQLMLLFIALIMARSLPLIISFVYSILLAAIIQRVVSSSREISKQDRMELAHLGCLFDAVFYFQLLLGGLIFFAETGWFRYLAVLNIVLSLTNYFRVPGLGRENIR